MKRFATFAAALIAAVVLAACTTAPPPGPPQNAFPVTATNSAATPVDTVTLGPGQEEVYRVTVPSSVSSADLLYVELDRNLRLEVRPAGTGYGNVAFSATSFDYFGSGLAGLTVAGAGSVEGQSVGTFVVCDGSCVILDEVPSTFYVRVVNTGATTVNNVNLYIYGDVYADETEGANDIPATAFSLTTFDGGAIETVGDVDYWHMSQNGIVDFDLNVGAIELEAYIVDGDGAPVPNQPGPYFGGESIQVFAGEFIRVWAVDPDLAASSSFSSYFLEYQGGPLSQATRAR